MNEKKINKNNSAAFNSNSAANEKKVQEKNDELDIIPIEASCSSEFSKGCIFSE